MSYALFNILDSETSLEKYNAISNFYLLCIKSNILLSKLHVHLKINRIICYLSLFKIVF